MTDDGAPAALAARPIPLSDPDTRPYWDGANQHRLVCQQCSACKHVIFPPKPACPRCLESGLDWISVSGFGTVYSFCITRMNFVQGYAAPYIVAWVTLDEHEDVRLNSNILECSLDEIHIGMPVEVVFEHRRPGVTVPQFRPRRRNIKDPK